MATLNMVVLADMVAPDPVAVADKLRQHTAQFGPLEIPAPKDGTAVFRMGKHLVFVAHMPAPIPAQELEWAANVAAWYWPDAAKELARQQSHVVVGTMSEADPITQHLLVTHTAAAVCEASNAVAVHWGSSGVVTPTELFLEGAKGAAPESLPIHLWLSVSWARLDDGRMEVVTHGLAEFDHPELGKRSAEPDEAIDFLYNIAGYIVSSGAKLEHGQTIGGSAEEKLAIVHAPAPWEGDDVVAWIGD